MCVRKNTFAKKITQPFQSFLEENFQVEKEGQKS
jgi:hypothetical protein